MNSLTRVYSNHNIFRAVTVQNRPAIITKAIDSIIETSEIKK